MFNRPRLLRSRKFRVPIPNDQGFTSQDHMSKPAAVRVLCAGDSSSCAEACIAVNSTSIPTTVILSEAKPQRSPKAIRGEARLSMSGHSRKWTCIAMTRDVCSCEAISHLQVFGIWRLKFPEPSFFSKHHVRPSCRCTSTRYVRICLGALAQLVRAPPCHGGGCGFKSRLSRISLIPGPGRSRS